MNNLFDYGVGDNCDLRPAQDRGVESTSGGGGKLQDSLF